MRRPRAHRAVVVVAGLLVAVSACGGSSSAFRPHSPFAAPSITTPGASTDPFGLATKVPTMPVSPDSAAMVTAWLDDQANHSSIPNEIGVNAAPYYTIGADQASIPIGIKPGCHDFRTGAGGTGPDVPIPVDAIPAAGADSYLVIYQPSSGTVWEIWMASKGADGSWEACNGGRFTDLATSPLAISGADGNGLSATGITYFGTAVMESDIASGAIDHVLSMAVSNCVPGKFVLPATRSDNPARCHSTNPDLEPEGTWFKFPASLAMPTGLAPYAQMVFHAIQTYGVLVVDTTTADDKPTGSNSALNSEATSDWARTGHTGTDPITTAMAGVPDYAVLDALPWSQIQVLTPPSS